jgi:catechol 2,3-dioxygenase-like lactoylglutathione lyase family enzyme
VSETSDRRFRVLQVDHVEVFVPGRREAAQWYERVLGLSIVPAHERFCDDPRGPLMISSDAGNTMLALFRGTPQGQTDSIGFHRTAFRVDGAEFLCFLDSLEQSELKDHRSRAVKRGDAVDHETAFSIYFCDPYGNRLEVTTYDHTMVRKALAI